MTYFALDTWYQIVRHIRTELRIPIWIVVNLSQPVLWLLLFTQIFKSTFAIMEVDYLQHFAPAVVVMTVMFGSVWAGMGMLEDIQMGVLSKMLATPVSRLSIIMSRVIGSMVMLVVQALIIFLIAVIMGLSIASGIGGVLFTIFLIILLGMGFSAFSNGLALVFQRQETLIAVINFISLPVMFLSSAFVPPDFLPRWLQIVRQGNPVEYAVLGIRSLVNDGWIWDNIWKVLLALGLWAIIAITFGMFMFRKQTE